MRWVLEVREDLVAHGAGLEGAAWLDVFELKEDAAACCAGERGGFDEGGLDPWSLGDGGCGLFWGDASHFACRPV